MTNAQEWLEKHYPYKEKTYRIYLNQQLEGVLDCSEYKDLREISISFLVDSSKFEIKKGSYRGYNDKKKYGTHETNIIPIIYYMTYENHKKRSRKVV